MEIRSLLFVGRRNAARSIMAETCFISAAIPGWRAFSAGWQTTHQIDPLTIRALQGQGFPTDSLYSKSVEIFRQPGAPSIDLCVFMDDELPDDAGSYPGKKEYWRVENPYTAGRDPHAYREALGMVILRISDLILSGRLSEFPADLRYAS